MDSVNWLKHQQFNYLDAEGMNELIGNLKKSSLKEVQFYTIKRFIACYKTYCIRASSNSVLVRVCRDYNKLEQYLFSLNDAGGVRDEITGKTAYTYVDEIFQEKIKRKKSLYTAFSGDKYKTTYKQIKYCVPKQISMLSRSAEGKRLKNVFKADISSAYPSEGSKSLPTLEKCKFISGHRIPPSSEYPFAFYIKSHHMAIYNEFDTHDWAKRKKWYTLYEKQFNDVEDSQEITILCKQSEYSLSDTFEDIYKRKINGDKIAKIGMNAAIGYFQKNTNPKLSHISAVIIGRCCERVMDIADKLIKEKNIPIFIATDSIAWLGKESTVATDKKYLGSFSYEYKDVEFYGTGPKAYQIKEKNGKIKTIYAGMKNGEEKYSLPFGKLPEHQGAERYLIDQVSGRITTLEF